MTIKFTLNYVCMHCVILTHTCLNLYAYSLMKLNVVNSGSQPRTPRQRHSHTYLVSMEHTRWHGEHMG